MLIEDKFWKEVSRTRAELQTGFTMCATVTGEARVQLYSNRFVPTALKLIALHAAYVREAEGSGQSPLPAVRSMAACGDELDDFEWELRDVHKSWFRKKIFGPDGAVLARIAEVLPLISDVRCPSSASDTVSQLEETKELYPGSLKATKGSWGVVAFGSGRLNEGVDASLCRQFGVRDAGFASEVRKRLAELGLVEGLVGGELLGNECQRERVVVRIKRPTELWRTDRPLFEAHFSDTGQQAFESIPAIGSVQEAMAKIRKKLDGTEKQSRLDRARSYVSARRELLRTLNGSCCLFHQEVAALDCEAASVLWNGMAKDRAALPPWWGIPDTSELRWRLLDNNRSVWAYAGQEQGAGDEEGFLRIHKRLEPSFSSSRFQTSVALFQFSEEPGVLELLGERGKPPKESGCV